MLLEAELRSLALRSFAIARRGEETRLAVDRVSLLDGARLTSPPLVQLLGAAGGAHPDTQCAVCRGTTATARSDAVKTACDHKDGQPSRTPYALQHAPGAPPDAQRTLRHHAYVFVMKIE